MKPAGDFEQLSKDYKKLGDQLEKVLAGLDRADARAIVQALLRNRGCLDEIQRLTPRVAELCRDLDPESRSGLRESRDSARAQAMRIFDLCSLYARNVEAALELTSAHLAQLRAGSQLLQSLKPVKQNYPKFIDSLG